MKLAAAEVGVAPRSLQRWKHRDDFVALIERSRGSVLDDNPTPEATLRAALSATGPSGAPDWKTRVSAARALIGADGPAAGKRKARETVIHEENLEG